MVDYSFFQSIENAFKKGAAERARQAEARKEQLAEEAKRLEYEQKMSEEKYAAEQERMKHQRLLEEQQREADLERARNNRQRFLPVKGIVDTTLTDSEDPPEVPFDADEDAFVRNSKLFRENLERTAEEMDMPEIRMPDLDRIPDKAPEGKGLNPLAGHKPAGQAAQDNDVRGRQAGSRVPSPGTDQTADAGASSQGTGRRAVAYAGETVFRPGPAGKAASETESGNDRPVSGTARDVLLYGPSKKNTSEYEEIHITKMPGDEYTKTVVTSNGKVIRAETDGDILSKKQVIRGGEADPYGPAEGAEDGMTAAAGMAQGQKPASGTRDFRNTAAPAPAAAGSQDSLPLPPGTQTSPKKEEEKAPEKVIIPKKEYKFPPIKLLRRGASNGTSKEQIQKEIRETAVKLQQTLQTFGVGVTVTHVSYGPSVTRYELQPEVGVKVSRIVSLTDDIKLSLAAADIRIEAPIPGKSAIGIEVPNKVKQSVVLRDLLESEAFTNAKSKLAFAAGRDIEGNTIIADVAKMPHVLVAGATGSGKSVCINSMIMSILYHAKPTEVKMIMVDPKVVELSVYNGIPHLLMPVVTDPRKAAQALNWAVAEMEKRYEKFAEFGVRGIEGYNTLIENDAPEGEDGKPLEKMTQILIIVDELADLMMVAANEVETSICRIAQKARAAGLYLVLATQRPSVDVITGLIKANIPSRIAFAVSSGTDSRTILDMNGAEKLLGRGDMLYDPAGSTKPLRVQGAFVGDDEVRDVVEFIKDEGPVIGGTYNGSVDLTAASSGFGAGNGSDRDEFFAECGRLVIDKEKASIGMLQRAFKLGFNRAARIMDQLADAGVVGEEEGTKPRRVLMSAAEFEDFLASGG
ncbi:MAG: DNA translocase FtsK [Lachnospiraceae bacterium]|nr:DNA translocase FtsK [Lachnospiraceae bacterium]